MKRIRETIVVEGRDDTNSILRAVDAETIETHGYGIRKETWALLDKAYATTGLIVLTDPDHAGEEIRRRILERYPDAREAFLTREEATAAGDVGVENAAPEAILEALERARGSRKSRQEEEVPRAEGVFTMEDLAQAGLCGTAKAADRRRKIGKVLGIGYGNAKAFLRKLNHYGVTKEEFDDATRQSKDE